MVFPEIIIFAPIFITLYFTIKYLRKYFDLSKYGVRVEATIVYYGPAKILRWHVPKMRYLIAGESYDAFVHYTAFSFLLPKRVGSIHRIFVSKENPKDCILASALPILIETLLVCLWCMGCVFAMIN